MIPPADEKKVQSLIAEMRANDGFAPVDLEQFWADQEVAIKGPFGDIPQVPLGAILTSECVYHELGVQEDFWRYQHDGAWRIELNTAYNDKAERIVGRRLLSEEESDPSLAYPETRRLHDVFEARNQWRGESWWLMQSANTPNELAALLDRVEDRVTNLRKFLLPENWEEEKARLMALGVKPPLYRGQRGPVTFATSVYGVENLLFLIVDQPHLAARFRDTMLKTMLEIARIKDEEAGYARETAPHGFGFADDNCCLLNPEMYEFFAYPILACVFERYSPDPGDSRYQHSDSAMGHLLPLFGTLNMTGVNFGPTVRAREIREYLPNAAIYGTLAPFTYSRNEHENILREFLRDYNETKEARGLVFATAGSINNGTRLTSMRFVMAAIQRHGRYE